MTRPVLIVGDVQGDAERLSDALEAFPGDEVDTIFLGDFFQGGRPGAAGGAQSARIARARANSRSILGNHDLFLLSVLEEVRDGVTPANVRDRGWGSLAEVWLLRRGDWADLRAVADDPDLEGWLRSLPLMLKLPDRTLVQHADDDGYAKLGPDVAAVNAWARRTLAEPHGAWQAWVYTIGRRAFDDVARLEAHLAHFRASRVVHGHTPHHGRRPQSSHDGRLWNFDGCFSRFWDPQGEGVGPVEATVSLLPPLETGARRSARAQAGAA
jgi:calcineurin-like phosphoesterase family protein